MKQIEVPDYLRINNDQFRDYDSLLKKVNGFQKLSTAEQIAILKCYRLVFDTLEVKGIANFINDIVAQSGELDLKVVIELMEIMP